MLNIPVCSIETYCFILDCSDGEIRIIPPVSNHKLIGRVEICVNGSWGTICNDFFDDNDAKVICKQLGYSSLGNEYVVHYLTSFPVLMNIIILVI